MTNDATTSAISRSEIEAALRAQPWFLASDQAIQDRLLSLPGDDLPKESCNGYLADLARRPELGGGVRVRRILEVLIPKGRIFGILTNIEVEKLSDPTVVFGYQYFSWRQGPSGGAKGLVFVESDSGEFTHVIILSTFSFAPGRNTNDLPGGFMEVGDESVLDRFRIEIGEELGIPGIPLKRIIRLGAYYPDRAMTNFYPEPLVGVLSPQNAGLIRFGESHNPDVFEMRSIPRMVPIAKLWGDDGLIAASDDGCFLVCVARLIAKGILKPPV